MKNRYLNPAERTSYINENIIKYINKVPSITGIIINKLPVTSSPKSRISGAKITNHIDIIPQATIINTLVAIANNINAIYHKKAPLV